MTDEVVEWRPWPRHPRYIVGADGTIIGPSGRVLKPLVQGGRASIGFWDGGYSRVKVAVIICETFHGPKPRPRMHAAHEDGDSLNDRAENLAWKTPAENNADKRRHGTAQIGERGTLAKLTDEKVRGMRRRRSAGETFASLARAYGVAEATATNAIKGKTWGHVL